MDWQEPAPLPRDVARWLVELNAPPRLGAHLRLVRQAAEELVDRASRKWPKLRFDRGAVLFGAASHDIGKAVHTAELSGPGSLHEVEGQALLEKRGVSPTLARFAVTHAAWKQGQAGELEDLLVALADHCWKGSRPRELEGMVSSKISAELKLEEWRVFLALDAMLQAIASQADKRLAWQATHPA